MGRTATQASWIGISSRSVTEDIKKWLAEEHEEEWYKATACKQAKTLIGEHLIPKRAADMRRLSRTEVKTLTEVFIGHGNLAYHRHKIGLPESPLCRLCVEDNGTSTHILCNCSAIRDTRPIFHRRSRDSDQKLGPGPCPLAWAVGSRMMF